MSADYFSPDYNTARQRFRDHIAKAGGQHEAHEIGQEGPEGEALTIDVGLFGNPQAPKRVVYSSGTHGVEGFFGSAVQLGCMERLIPGCADTPDLGLVLIHAVNPYGFAHVRRVNEHNVDLNRNFLPPGRPYSGADPAYGKFDPLLNPQTPPGGVEFYLLRTLYNIARHGMAKLKNALVSGQYEFEKGLFFGGKEPSASYRILEKNLPRWLEGAERVMHVDFHTGLGPWGTYVLGACEPADEGEIGWLNTRFDPSRVQGLEPEGVLYEIHGEFGAWCKQTMANVDYHAVLAEFGTHPSLRVLAALRAENRAHHWAPRDHKCVAKSKTQIMEAFAPSSKRWKALCVDKGLQVAEQAIAAVNDAG